MGSLALAYGVKGLGEGLIRQQDIAAEQKAAEEANAREIQLQRMRDKAARERTEMQVTAQRETQKARYEAEANQLRERLEAGQSEQAKQHAHEIEVEQMRQQARANLEQQRLDVKEPTFEQVSMSGTDPVLDFQGNVIKPGSPARDVLRDKMTGITYDQKSAGGYTVFVPTTQTMAPTAERVKAGQSPGVIKWLTTAPTPQEQMDRLFQFQKLFHHVPPQYFTAYGRGFGARTQQRQSATTTAPATVAE